MTEVNKKMSYLSLGLPPKHGKIPVAAHLYGRNPNIIRGTTMMGLQLGDSSICPLSLTNESLPSMAVATTMDRMIPNVNIGIVGGGGKLIKGMDLMITNDSTTATNTSNGLFNLLDPTAISYDYSLRLTDDIQTVNGSNNNGEINKTISTCHVNQITNVMGAVRMNNKSLQSPPPLDHHYGISAMSTSVHDMTKKLENHNNNSSVVTLLLPSSSLLSTATLTRSLFEKISTVTPTSSLLSTLKGISEGDGEHTVGEIAARVLSSTSSINCNRRKKRGHPRCRPIDPNMDPKQTKRILANRLSAQKSQIRKLAYLAELEKTVLALEERVNSIAPEVAEHDHQRLLMRIENTRMKQKMATLISEQAFKDAQFQALKQERDKLVQLCMLQQQQNGQQYENNQLQGKQQQPLVMINIFEPLQQPNLVLHVKGSEHENDISINGGDIDRINTNSISNN